MTRKYVTGAVRYPGAESGAGSTASTVPSAGWRHFSGGPTRKGGPCILVPAGSGEVSLYCPAAGCQLPFCFILYGDWNPPG